MKKVLLLLVCLTVAGCASGGEVMKCKVNGKEAIFTLKEGMIDEYKLDGTSKTNREIADINGEYFTSSKNNEEAKTYLKDYVESIGGTCDEE